MYIYRYDDTFKNGLINLISSRGIEESFIDDLPATGLVAVRNGQIIAAGFLRFCEGTMAIFDSFITDPSVDKVGRREALDIIGHGLESIAILHGFNKLLALTKEKNIRLRAVNQGFNKINYSVMVKSL